MTRNVNDIPWQLDRLDSPNGGTPALMTHLNANEQACRLARSISPISPLLVNNNGRPVENLIGVI